MIEEKEEVKQEDFDKFVDKILKFKPEDKIEKKQDKKSKPDPK